MNNDLEKYHFYKNKKGTVDVAEIRLAMQKIMQKHAGVFRNDILLNDGVNKMKDIYKQFDDVYIDDKSDEFNSEFIELLELKNLLDNSLVTIYSANYRKESRGAHSHENFSERNDNDWLCHTISKLNNNDVILSKRNVIFKTLNNEVDTVKLAKRVY